MPSMAIKHRPDDCMDAGVRATQEAKAENRSLHGVNEDSRTELTPLGTKRSIFSGDTFCALSKEIGSIK
jgi:hypothetical protein